MRKVFFLGLLFIFACIDRINIDVPDYDEFQLIVDGVITDEPGPYTVKLSRSASPEKFFLKYSKGVEGAKITLADDMGTSETLIEKEPGLYQTKADGIQGVVGRSYSIRIETGDGKVYESLPDRMKPVGDLDSLYYEFESYLPLNDQTRYGFKFYIDATGIPEIDNLVRWKFTSIFQIFAEPKLHIRPPGCTPDPPPCSGWIFGEFGLQEVSDICTCCTCWVTRYEDTPKVSDNQFVVSSGVKKVEVGYIPLEYFPFQEGKYRAEVKQMSLSKEAFDYWRLIQAQKEGAASLFQPPIGKIRSNIFEKNGTDPVLGVFYASAVKKKQLYLTYKDFDLSLFSRIPLWDCEKGKIAQSCLLAFPNSSSQPPADWK